MACSCRKLFWFLSSSDVSQRISSSIDEIITFLMYMAINGGYIFSFTTFADISNRASIVVKRILVRYINICRRLFSWHRIILYAKLLVWVSRYMLKYLLFQPIYTMNWGFLSNDEMPKTFVEVLSEQRFIYNLFM